MQESWPAWGGSTSVGTTSSAPSGVKSRRRVSGVERTTRCGEAHSGRRRSVMSCHQRRPSLATSIGVRPARNAVAQYCAVPLSAAENVSSAASTPRRVTGGTPHPGGMGRSTYPMLTMQTTYP
jgi:hypothetical protein